MVWSIFHSPIKIHTYMWLRVYSTIDERGQYLNFVWHWQIVCFFFFFLAPHFVHSFAHGDFVYFFFRETAVEYINCGKVSYYSFALSAFSTFIRILYMYTRALCSKCNRICTWPTKWHFLPPLPFDFLNKLRRTHTCQMLTGLYMFRK